MKFYTNKMAMCSVAAFGLAMLAACGDDNTTEVIESTGHSTIAAGEAMPECTSANEGDIVFVTDSAAVYYCAGGLWSTLNGKDGATGEKGETGAEGKATNGTSCTAKTVENGIEVSCGGEVVGTITNGNPGTGCEAELVENGIEVSCGGEVVGTIKNGEPGNATDGKSAYELAKANGFTGTEKEWLSSLKGENCIAEEYTDESSNKTGYKLFCGGVEKGVLWNGVNGTGCTAEKKDDGSIDVSCDNVYVGTLTNGKSAYELAKEKDESIGDVSEWLESLKGKSCEIEDIKDEKDGSKVIGYTVTCGTDSKTILNGKAGVGCSTDDKGNGVVELTCGDDAKPITLFKATCGSEAYDPETQYCHILNGKLKIEELLIDTREESNVQKYKTVEICDSKNENCQIWMAQNLNYNAPSSKCGGERGSEERDCDKYGRLYAWVTVIGKSECVEGVYCENKNEGVQGVCPDGWHVPSKPEWETLFSNVGGSGTAGLKLKSVDGWKNYTDEGVERSGNGIDAYGFTVIPVSGGSIIDLLTTVAIFWTSSEMDGSYAYLVDFDPDEKASVSKCAKNGHYGTVRCIKGAASN